MPADNIRVKYNIRPAACVQNDKKDPGRYTEQDGCELNEDAQAMKLKEGRRIAKAFGVLFICESLYMNMLCEAEYQEILHALINIDRIMRGGYNDFDLYVNQVKYAFIRSYSDNKLYIDF